MGPRDGLDFVEKRKKSLYPTVIRTPDRPSRSPVVIQNTPIRLFLMVRINRLTPKDPYSGRTAPLTSKVAFYIFIQQI